LIAQQNAEDLQNAQMHPDRQYTRDRLRDPDTGRSRVVGDGEIRQRRQREINGEGSV
jgi:hypothetical protein